MFHANWHKTLAQSDIMHHYCFANSHKVFACLHVLQEILFGGTMPLPQLTDEQRKAALEKAAAARHARAELRENIKAGNTSLEDVLNSDDPIANRMKVSALIESLPGYGKAKAAKIMEDLNISPSRRVKGLGARQREQLLEVLSK